MIASIVCGGTPVSASVLKEYCARSDIVIAADAGFDYMKRIDLRPDVLVGDMDSIAPESLNDVNGIEVIRFPCDKDRSDTEIAVELAMTRGADRIILLAGTGLRMDHFLANMSLLARHPGRVMMADDSSTAFSIGGGHSKCTVKNCAGTIFSTISFGLSATNVVIRGAKWETTGIDLFPGSLGLSNIITSDSLIVSVGSGNLIVIVECSDEHVRFDMNQIE